ncbi:hypothetical protein GTQ99_00360 [Kineococcus sp. T13]|uniref:hypothetical protein n=1 Tax=Kineococcus vitellinus TaxID=2696565 RepID=UPI0014136CD1|nr:hypothetical protein [Kineococcus vitellinus]NAZ73883.1 hypothetical protein [Kineococcus vitellinus]
MIDVPNLEERAAALVAQANKQAAFDSKTIAEVLERYREDFASRVAKTQETLDATNEPHPFIDLTVAQEELAVAERAQELAEED